MQCGPCEVGCPEHPITLQPRIATDPVARNAARLLHEDEFARCTSCGTPFIGRSLLASSLARIKDFPGLADAGGIDRLKLCPACRQGAAMQV
jgi:ferredoxin